MGKIVNELDKLILSKPRMLDYDKFNNQELELMQHVILNYVKPNKLLRVYRPFMWDKEVKPKKEDFWDLVWEDKIALENAFKADDLFQIISIIYDVTEKEFMLLQIVNVFSCLKFIEVELEKLHQAEEDRLHSKLSSDEVNAGAEELQEYGYYNALKSICPNLLDQDRYLKLPYSLVFRELCYMKLLNDINKNLTRNAKPKN